MSHTTLIHLVGNNLYHLLLYGLHTVLVHTLPCILLVFFTWKLLIAIREADKKHAILIGRLMKILKNKSKNQKNIKNKFKKFKEMILKILKKMQKFIKIQRTTTNTKEIFRNFSRQNFQHNDAFY